MNETEIQRMVVRILGNNSDYVNMLKGSDRATGMYATAVDAKVAKLEREFVKRHRDMIRKATTLVANGMRSVGTQLTKFVTLPAAAIGGFGVKAFADFDNAMVESTSIMSVTADQVERMRKTALQLSADGKVLQGPKDLAESYFFLASAGKNAEQSIALLNPVAQFATAGAFDMALATDLLTDSQSALGMSSKDVAEDQRNLIKIGDTLVKANTLANASVQQFAEALTSDAATASQTINSELETTVAILALYADKGKKAAEAGNLYGRAVRLLTKAARDNADAFKENNIVAIDETTGEYRNFIDILEDINKASAGMTKPEVGKLLSDLGFEALAQKSILPLLGATDQLKRYEKELKNAGGITEQVANDQMESFSKQMLTIWNRIKVSAIGIGEVLAPAVKTLGDWVRAGLDYWDSLSDSFKRSTVLITGIVAVLGPLITIFGTLLAAAAPVIAFIGSSFSAALGVITAYAAPVLAFGAALAAGVALFVNWMGGIEATFNAVIQKANELYQFVKPVLSAIYDLGVTVFSGIAGIAIYVFDLVASSYATQFRVMKELLGPFATSVRDTYVDIIQGVDFALQNFGLIWDVAVAHAAAKLYQFKEQFVYLFTGVLPPYLNYFSKFWFNVISDIAHMGMRIMKNLVENMGTIILNLPALVKGETNFSELWTPLTEGFKSAVMELPEIPKRQKNEIELALNQTAEDMNQKLGNRLTQFFKDKAPQLPKVKEEEVKNLEKEIEKATSKGAVKSAAKVSTEVAKTVKDTADKAAKETSSAMNQQLTAVQAGTAESLASYLSYQSALHGNALAALSSEKSTGGKTELVGVDHLRPEVNVAANSIQTATGTAVDKSAGYLKSMAKNMSELLVETKRKANTQLEIVEANLGGG